MSKEYPKPVVIVDSSIIYSMGVRRMLVAYSGLSEDRQLFFCLDEQDKKSKPGNAMPPFVFRVLTDDTRFNELEDELLEVEEHFPDALFILYSSQYNFTGIDAVVRLKNVTGYFLLEEDPRDLYKFLDSVFACKTVLSDGVLANYLRREHGKERAVEKISPQGFTPSEQDFIQKVNCNIPAEEIRRELNIPASRWRKLLSGVARKIRKM